MERHDDMGIPILPLDEKVDALKYCLLSDAAEDAMGHLFDLMHHLAPGWQFGPFRSLQSIADHYGSRPTPIDPPNT
jgi:hypothetical protein